MAALGIQPANVTFAYSFPEAFRQQQLSSFQGAARNAVSRALRMVSGSDALIQSEPEFETESVATAQYFINKLDTPPTEGLVTFDIGGQTTDVAVVQSQSLDAERLAWRGSFPVGRAPSAHRFPAREPNHHHAAGTWAPGPGGTPGCARNGQRSFGRKTYARDRTAGEQPCVHGGVRHRPCQRLAAWPTPTDSGPLPWRAWLDCSTTSAALSAILVKRVASRHGWELRYPFAWAAGPPCSTARCFARQKTRQLL